MPSYSTMIFCYILHQLRRSCEQISYPLWDFLRKYKGIPSNSEIPSTLPNVTKKIQRDPFIINWFLQISILYKDDTQGIIHISKTSSKFLNLTEKLQMESFEFRKSFLFFNLSKENTKAQNLGNSSNIPNSQRIQRKSCQSDLPSKFHTENRKESLQTLGTSSNSTVFSKEIQRGSLKFDKFSKLSDLTKNYKGNPSTFEIPLQITKFH